LPPGQVTLVRGAFGVQAPARPAFLLLLSPTVRWFQLRHLLAGALHVLVSPEPSTCPTYPNQPWGANPALGYRPLQVWSSKSEHLGRLSRGELPHRYIMYHDRRGLSRKFDSPNKDFLQVLSQERRSDCQGAVGLPASDENKTGRRPKTDPHPTIKRSSTPGGRGTVALLPPRFAAGIFCKNFA